MDNTELKETLTRFLKERGNPEPAFEEGNEWLTLYVEPKDWRPVATFLKSDEALKFDYLYCLTCYDGLGTATAKTNLVMVYHLTSTRFRHTVVIKSKLERRNPAIESVCDLWKTAEFHEREVYELFGVFFSHHPDLRLLILPEGWEGKNPLRKDFEDPVNMIRL